tara:strand:+ start:227 stop:403 length:177 start_codon:yes stop_codon:yes gene_type:complete
MEFELKRDYNRNGKIIKAGQVMDVTQEHYEWLEENGYGKEQRKKKKTDEKASDKKQEL